MMIVIGKRIVAMAVMKKILISYLIFCSDDEII